MSLLTTFSKYKDYLDKPISADMINDIQYYIENKWYLQILKQYGIVIVLILIQHYIIVEDYNICDKLKTAIDNSNTHFGTNYAYTLEEYGDMS